MNYDKYVQIDSRNIEDSLRQDNVLLGNKILHSEVESNFWKPMIYHE